MNKWEWPEKICLRCGKKFTNPIPEVTNPNGVRADIFTDDWCAKCNQIALMASQRRNTIFFDKNVPLRPIAVNPDSFAQKYKGDKGERT